MNRHGFTLVELLVVMAILAALAAMLTPIVTLAKRQSERTATTAVMHKVDTAVRLFRNEVGAYPWQQSYADIDGGESWTNRLGYQLGADIDTVNDLPLVRQDAHDAAGRYGYACSVNLSTGVVTEPSAAALGAFAYRSSRIYRTFAWISPSWQDITNNTNSSRATVNPYETLAKSAVLNRIAAELARVHVHAGNPWLTGTRIEVMTYPNSTSSTLVDHTGAQLLGSPASAAKAGWAHDYLLGEVDKRHRNGDAILDAWGMPLIYVGRTLEGGRFSRTYLFNSVVYHLPLRMYGLHRRGRTSLERLDPVSGTPLAADPPALPDPTTPIVSDRRFYAAPGFAYDIELWSAGPDRSFAWMRPDPRNRDNVALAPYDRGIP